MYSASISKRRQIYSLFGTVGGASCQPSLFYKMTGYDARRTIRSTCNGLGQCCQAPSGICHETVTMLNGIHLLRRPGHTRRAGQANTRVVPALALDAPYLSRLSARSALYTELRL